VLDLNYINPIRENTPLILSSLKKGFNRTREHLLHFLYGDNYLLIEVLNHYVQITVLKASLERRKIYIKKNWILPVADFNISGILRELEAGLKKVRKLERYKIILSLDSDFATTIHSSVSLVRPNRKETIDEADIDNLISQAIWRFFDRKRLRVARKMNIDDVDVLLSDVRIRGIKLDGHKIVNPIGFKAKSVEIFFSQTFIIRELMRGIRDLLPKDNIALITESGTAMSHVLNRVLEENQFLVANLFPNQTSVFSALNGRLAHLDNFGWGENDLVHLLARYFRVDPPVARQIIQNYAEDNASQVFLRRFENILVKELQLFANGLETLANDGVSLVYVNSFFTMPPIVFSGRFQSRFEKSLKLVPLSTNLITEKLGYDVQLKKTVRVRNLFSLLSAFFEINFLPQNDKMSHLANRRVRWLVT